MVRLIAGLAADWLAARHDDLDQRFERARRRFPALKSEPVLERLAELLPPLAGPEPQSGDLLGAVYDLVLLHAGRDSFATHPGIALLLRETFPKLRPLLLERPSLLPGALSNAVENMGARGPALAEALGRLAGLIASADMLLDAAAVVAWRLGEARLRQSALEVAARLPPGLVLEALDLADWPEPAAAIALAALRADAWRAPRALLSEATLRSLAAASPQAIAALEQRLQEEAPATPPAAWEVIARIGDFAGFGGNFEVPPWLLDGGGRHRFFLRCGPHYFRMDADIFGSVCRPHPPLDLAVRSAVLDGAPPLPGVYDVTCVILWPGLLATSHADSHRLRIAAPKRAPL